MLSENRSSPQHLKDNALKVSDYLFSQYDLIEKLGKVQDDIKKRKTRRLCKAFGEEEDEITEISAEETKRLSHLKNRALSASAALDNSSISAVSAAISSLRSIKTSLTQEFVSNVANEQSINSVVAAIGDNYKAWFEYLLLDPSGLTVGISTSLDGLYSQLIFRMFTSAKQTGSSFTQNVLQLITDIESVVLDLPEQNMTFHVQVKGISTDGEHLTALLFDGPDNAVKLAEELKPGTVLLGVENIATVHRMVPTWVKAQLKKASDGPRLQVVKRMDLMWKKIKTLLGSEGIGDGLPSHFHVYGINSWTNSAPQPTLMHSSLLRCRHCNATLDQDELVLC